MKQENQKKIKKEIVKKETKWEQSRKYVTTKINNFKWDWKIAAIILAVILAIDIIGTKHHARFNINDILNDLFTPSTMISENTVFLGDSITNQYMLEEFYEDLPIVNSGISGFETAGILAELDDMVYRYNPSKVFLMIGTNDINTGKSDAHILKNIEEIIQNIKKNRPHAKMYVESIYPINETEDKSKDTYSKHRSNERIMKLNDEIKKICDRLHVTYINVYSSLLNDKSEELKSAYTTDGLHLTDLGYLKVTTVLLPYVKGEK